MATPTLTISWAFYLVFGTFLANKFGCYLMQINQVGSLVFALRDNQQTWRVLHDGNMEYSLRPSGVKAPGRHFAHPQSVADRPQIDPALNEYLIPSHWEHLPAV